MPEFDSNLLQVVPRTQCSKCQDFEPVSSFRFENPHDIKFKAGQFFFITIKGDRELQHHFSFSSSPTETGYLEFTTKLRNTDFKNELRKLKIDDKVVLKAPYGDFVIDKGLKKIGMISGGIGITPHRSICKYCTDEEFSTNIILLYSSHSEEDLLFKYDFEKMASLNQNLKVVFTVSEPSEQWKGYTGRINSQMIAKEIPDYRERTFFLSGPAGMTSAMEKQLLDLKVSKDKIKKETFPRY